MSFTIQTMQRMPLYLQYLKELELSGVEIISATETAQYFKFNEVLVRKDFGLICSTKGKPKVGFKVCDLIYDIEEILGYHSSTDVALVGIGSLGKALIGYEGFSKCGLTITAGFDKNESIIGQKIHGNLIHPTSEIASLCKHNNIKIGIIAVPESEAQSVCDSLVEGGVIAIWNFAPTNLKVPESVIVKNENILTSLTLLIKQCERQNNKKH